MSDQPTTVTTAQIRRARSGAVLVHLMLLATMLLGGWLGGLAFTLDPSDPLQLLLMILLAALWVEASVQFALPIYTRAVWRWWVLA